MEARLPATTCCIALSALLLAGCATFRAYEGGARPAAETARLSPAIMPMRQILIQAVDGKPLGPLHDRVEILPGRHEIEAVVTLQSVRRRVYFLHTLEFVALAGHEYMLYADLDLYGPRTFIMDQALGTVVAETITRPGSASTLSPR